MTLNLEQLSGNQQSLFADRCPGEIVKANWVAYRAPEKKAYETDSCD